MDPQIQELKSLIDTLCKRDRRQLVFGSSGHRYEFAKPIAEAKVLAFERQHGVELPVDYRRYITQIADGGAGPYYGLLPLSRAAEGCVPSKPFPWTEKIDYSAEPNPWSEEEINRLADWPGQLRICHEGCAYFFCLIVNGPTYGKI